MILEERTLLMLEAFEGVELLSQDAINKQKSFLFFPPFLYASPTILEAKLSEAGTLNKLLDST